MCIMYYVYEFCLYCCLCPKVQFINFLKHKNEDVITANHERTTNKRCLFEFSVKFFAPKFTTDCNESLSV